MHPTLVPAKQLIANVDGVMNAVLVAADAVGPTLYYGPGAGGAPTASSVIADLVDVARGFDAAHATRVPPLAFQAGSLADLPVLPISAVTSAYYLRITALDAPGVLARIATLLADEGISIEAVIQKQSEIRHVAGEACVPIIILTQRVREAQLEAALGAIQALAEVRGPARVCASRHWTSHRREPWRCAAHRAAQSERNRLQSTARGEDSATARAPLCCARRDGR